MAVFHPASSGDGLGHFSGEIFFSNSTAFQNRLAVMLRKQQLCGYSFLMSEGLRLKDQPASERPRERLVAHGASNLSNAELIDILLRTGLKGANAVEVGRQLVHKFGSLQSEE